jgi:hypothetical protein
MNIILAPFLDYFSFVIFLYKFIMLCKAKMACHLFVIDFPIAGLGGGS